MQQWLINMVMIWVLDGFKINFVHKFVETYISLWYTLLPTSYFYEKNVLTLIYINENDVMVCRTGTYLIFIHL